uniref:Bm10187 n=1 Tax=Brugia malayi TaxID=6279 RepID=A0A1I9G331_BRUMA|nr:Bm10187 [Brugia malayi]
MIASYAIVTGDFEKANSILANFDHRYPGYAVIALRRIGIERRFAIRQAGDRLVIVMMP